MSTALRRKATAVSVKEAATSKRVAPSAKKTTPARAEAPATTVAAYLKGLPADRRAALEQLLVVIRERLPRGYEEAFAFGMIAWQVPLSRYPDTYNGKPLMYAALASQKNHMAVYLCHVNVDPVARAAFEARWAKSGKKKPDMGKACVRFGKIEDLALDAVAEAIAGTPVDQFVAAAQAVRAARPAKR
jgi:hypothetical protein